MTDEKLPPFTVDLEEATRVFLQMAAGDSEDAEAARRVLRLGFQAGAAWAFAAVARDVRARASEALDATQARGGA